MRIPAKARPFEFGAFQVVPYQSADAAIAAGELESQNASPGLLPHRLDWLQAMDPGRAWWLSVRDLQERPVAGFSVSVIRARSLPGHRFLRLDRLRFAPDPVPAEAAVHCLLDIARRDGRTVGITVEPFFANEAERDRARAVLERAGFRLARGARLYRHTVRIDLTPEQKEILASFHHTARQNIREVGKRPVEIRLVQDSALAPRLDEILTESFARTDASAEREPWTALVAYCRAHPDLARLVSLVRTDRVGPESLVAFALGLNHGDHVEYAVAGSTRTTDLRMSFGYALVWDLICWARDVGAQWFDLGGIVPPSAQDDERRGIHDFKRRFSRDVIEVRQEWSLEVRPTRGAWVRAVGRLSQWARVVRRTARGTGSRARTQIGEVNA